MTFTRSFRVYVLVVLLTCIRTAPVGANSGAAIATVALVFAGPRTLASSVSCVPNTIPVTKIGTAFVGGSIILNIPELTVPLDPNAKLFGTWLDRHPHSARRCHNCYLYAQSAVLDPPLHSLSSAGYLMRPPLPHPNAHPTNAMSSLSHWIVVKTFLSREECEAHKAKQWEQCVTSDDPRLRGK
jgi:hypothetical protein